MDLLDRTDVSNKNPGDSLTSADINSINNTVNAAVSYINENLKDFCNANAEINNYERKLTLSGAIRLVPEARRRSGLKIRFLGSEGAYSEYIYKGPDADESNWTNEDNWKSPYNIIDGGEW